MGVVHGVAVLFLACALVPARAQFALGPESDLGPVTTFPTPTTTPPVGRPVGPPVASGWSEGYMNPFGKAADPFVEVGGCAYDELDSREYPFYNVMLVAEGSAFVAGKTLDGCGSCYEIQCADTAERCKDGPLSTSIIAMVGGNCDEGCDDTDFNLHTGAFSQLAAARGGGIQVRIREAPCTPDGNVVVNIEEYRASDGGYVKFAVRNIPGDGGLTSVEIKGSNEVGGWFEADNTFGAAWEASVLPDPPLDLRLTNTEGEQLVLKAIISVPGFVGDVLSDEQFAGSFAPKAAKPSNQPAPIPIPGSGPPPSLVPSPVPSPLPSLVPSPVPSLVPSPTPLPAPPSPSPPSLKPPAVGVVSTPTPGGGSTSPSTGSPPRRSTTSPSPILPTPGSAASKLLDGQP
ncbi:unnamed protein product [Ostreobium quekettii]|uniref:Expansin-like EG45 domain-containing protein n=1 Tax=Ostreobium quekettii TaxID=121088 RepID=A0A8S1IQZ4_9CHLO|nr:unnamed protein product [Ostreobium quekettii]|eukprot:evm.model.scf_26.8 EVM.evm.TU.scf_26.8   scf_26:51149-55295(-)